MTFLDFLFVFAISVVIEIPFGMLLVAVTVLTANKEDNKAAISKYSPSPYGDKVLYGMDELIKQQIDNFLSEHKDEIIDSAAKALAERLARTKKAKELING